MIGQIGGLRGIEIRHEFHDAFIRLDQLGRSSALRLHEIRDRGELRITLHHLGDQLDRHGGRHRFDFAAAIPKPRFAHQSRARIEAIVAVGTGRLIYLEVGFIVEGRIAQATLQPLCKRTLKWSIAGEFLRGERFGQIFHQLLLDRIRRLQLLDGIHQAVFDQRGVVVGLDLSHAPGVIGREAQALSRRSRSLVNRGIVVRSQQPAEVGLMGLPQGLHLLPLLYSRSVAGVLFPAWPGPCEDCLQAPRIFPLDIRADRGIDYRTRRPDLPQRGDELVDARCGLGPTNDLGWRGTLLGRVLSGLGHDWPLCFCDRRSWRRSWPKIIAEGRCEDHIERAGNI